MVIFLIDFHTPDVYAVDKCSQPAKVEGSCHDYVLAYSYVSSSGRCEAFYYGGCEGNENRFESAEDCESECMRAPTTRRPHQQTERPDQTIGRFSLRINLLCILREAHKCWGWLICSYLKVEVYMPIIICFYLSLKF